VILCAIFHHWQQLFEHESYLIGFSLNQKHIWILHPIPRLLLGTTDWYWDRPVFGSLSFFWFSSFLEILLITFTVTVTTENGGFITESAFTGGGLEQDNPTQS
jgi:hypothetical protein